MFTKISPRISLAVLLLLTALPVLCPLKAEASARVTILYRSRSGALYTAAQAKKDHYLSPIDHSRLEPVATRASPTFRQFPLASLPQRVMRIGKGSLHIWVMSTEAKREEGLMFVTNAQIKNDQAMLFVFPAPALQDFWMKNTLIPLDIAFIGANDVVLNTTRMKAEDLTPVPSNGPAKYALEMKVGTLKRLGIHAGMHVRIPGGLTAE
jgi:uncharacterized membrane protein (UPF0127 family)